jgi:hypothetical protein
MHIPKPQREAKKAQQFYWNHFKETTKVTLEKYDEKAQ